MTTTEASVDAVEAFLTEEGPAIDEALQAALLDLGVGTSVLDLLVEYPRRPAKRLRPALCIATCRAFGGRRDDVLASAVAIELLHNSFLVHDDVVDASLMRRGEPTLHEMVGTPLALTASAGLGTAAFGMLHDNYPRLGLTLSDRIAREFRTMLARTLRGQATELTWNVHPTIDLEPHDYLDMVVHKTCWYTTINPLRVGALVGTWGSVDPDRFNQFGVLLGAAFQAQDDLLNLVGDQGRYGKESLGDIREGKRTLMLIRLAHLVDGPDAAVLAEFLRTPQDERSDEQIDAVFDLMQNYGTIEWARSYASQWVRHAEVAFDVAFAGAQRGHDLEFLRSVITYMIARDS